MISESEFNEAVAGIEQDAITLTNLIDEISDNRDLTYLTRTMWDLCKEGSKTNPIAPVYMEAFLATILGYPLDTDLEIRKIRLQAFVTDIMNGLKPHLNYTEFKTERNARLGEDA